MTLVEAVFGEEHHLVEEFIGHLVVDTALGGALHKNAPMFLHLRHLFLAHGPAQQVSFPQGVTSKILGDAHDLLLIHHDSVGFAENRLQGAVSEVDRLASMLPVDELGNQSGIERARAIQRQD